MNKVIETITNRVSCRSYNDKKVPLSKLNQILEAAKYAPSAMNRQICKITVVRKSSLIEQLRKLGVELCNRDVMYGANTICLVSAPRNDRFAFTDASVILENIFVAATSLKINSCWINQFDEILFSEQGKKLRNRLGINDDEVVVGSAILGYQKEDAELVKKDRKDFIKII